mmetsp:Transcript_37711/g.107732  ORF Transcript_37711/g.107732 Transcript_37711/m.107732 type:complete len:222 (-) Transcript_37711:600-1265(-)
MEPHRTTTATPTTRTSSMASLPSTRETARAGFAAPRAPRSRNAAALRASTSSTVSATTKTATITKASRLFNSPQAIHPMSAARHFQRVTSALASSGMCKESTSGFAAGGIVPFSYITSMSSRNAMHGLVIPMTSKHQKAAVMTRLRRATPVGPMHLRIPHGDARVFCPGAARSVAGCRIPKDDTVDPMQKMLKQVKPMSSCISPARVGGWSKPLMRCCMRM